jgi:hypothetical protein
MSFICTKLLKRELERLISTGLSTRSARENIRVSPPWYLEFLVRKRSNKIREQGYEVFLKRFTYKYFGKVE